MIDKSKIIITKTKYIKASSYKLKNILKLFIGKSYIEVLKLLEQNSCKIKNIIWENIKFGISKLYTFIPENIYIKFAYINKGSILKRFQPRARGKNYCIKKKKVHIITGIKVCNFFEKF